MSTCAVTNNDVLSAVKVIKKEQQRDNVFKIIKFYKCHQSNRAIQKERLQDIVKRKLKDAKEKTLSNQLKSISTSKTPFMMNTKNYLIAILHDNQVFATNKNTNKIIKLTTDQVNFDNIDESISKFCNEVE